MYDLAAQSISSHSQAVCIFEMHLTDMHFILHPLLISCMRLGLLASASKQFLVHLNLLACQLFQLVCFLDSLLHGLLEAISKLDSLVIPYVTLMHNGLEATSLGHISLSQKTSSIPLTHILYYSIQQTHNIRSSVDIIITSYSSKKMGYT